MLPKATPSKEGRYNFHFGAALSSLVGLSENVLNYTRDLHGELIGEPGPLSPVIVDRDANTKPPVAELLAMVSKRLEDTMTTLENIKKQIHP